MAFVKTLVAATVATVALVGQPSTAKAGLFGDNHWGDCMSSLIADVYQDNPTRRSNQSAATRLLLSPFFSISCLIPT